MFKDLFTELEPSFEQFKDFYEEVLLYSGKYSRYDKDKRLGTENSVYLEAQFSKISTGILALLGLIEKALEGADLRCADLRKADLTEVNLTGVNLENAISYLSKRAELKEIGIDTSIIDFWDDLDYFDGSDDLGDGIVGGSSDNG